MQMLYSTEVILITRTLLNIMNIIRDGSKRMILSTIVRGGKFIVEKYDFFDTK